MSAADQEVLAGRASEPAHAEGGEPPGLLELAEDRLDDGFTAGVASAGVRLTELEAHRAGGPAVLGLEEPVVFIGMLPAVTGGGYLCSTQYCWPSENRFCVTQ